MSITVRPELERAIRARAEAEGLSVEAYVEQLVRADQRSDEGPDRPDPACGREATAEIERKLAVVRAAALHESPTADIETMLAEIEAAYELDGGPKR